MKIVVVDAHRDNLVTVILRPNLLERLLGSVTEERFAERTRAPFGGHEWRWDHDGKLVGERVQRAINRAIARSA